MMVRLLRSSKWELLMFFVLLAVLSSCLWIWGPDLLSAETGRPEQLVIILLVQLLVAIGIGYWAAKRIYHKIDSLYYALKEAASRNYSVRLPAATGNSFASLYEEFNTMMIAVERRMKLLQQYGEHQVLREAASNEAAVHEERRRLARDLHDTVSQQLFAIHMSASSLPRLLAASPERGAEVMQQLIDMSALAQRQMRNFIAQLRPMELEGRSLEEALSKWFPDYCRQNQLQGVFEWQMKEPLSEAKEHQFFLIVQEAMANVVKHAEASRVTLTLSSTAAQLLLTLQDDGKGFRPDEVRQGSYGLSTMQERAQRLGGEAEIISKSGKGTRLRVIIPNYREEKLDEQPETLAHHDRG